MAAGDLAESFQDKVSCSICLEYFTDPVTIECGQNFCRACLSQCWGEPEPNFSCPQCRESALQRDLRPHGQLGNLAELVKCLRLQAGPEPEGQRVGDRHQEALKLSCEEDQPPLCLVCDRSWAHRTRTVVPMEEAAQEHREQIPTRLQHLWEETEELLGLKSDWDKERERLLRQTEVERPLVVSKCEGLHQFLAEQERLLLARLGELGEEIGRRREDNATHLGEEISRLSALITELEGKRQQPVLELLQADEKAMSPHPVPESPELEKRIRDFPQENNLQEAVTGFLGLTRVLSRVIMVHLAHLLMKNYHGGHVAIRLALGGCANRPFFRIVAAYNKRARDSKYLEQVGCYDPLPNSHNEKLVGLNIERIKHWIGSGAHVKKPVEKLLGLSGFFPLHPMTITNAERLRKRRALKAITASEEETPGD
ncbi:unnamed protein product [Lepidochelys olivacea]